MGGVACIPYDTLSSFMQQEEISMNIAISNYWHDIMGMSPAAKALHPIPIMRLTAKCPDTNKNNPITVPITVIPPKCGTFDTISI